MRKAILIQARLSSSRFPGKMLQLLNRVPLVEFVYARCLASEEADVVAVITSDEASDDALSTFCKERHIPCFRGSLENVLERYIGAAEVYDADVVGRVCGDSPFVDIGNLDAMFRHAETSGCEYVRFETEHAGFLSEVITLKALKKEARFSHDKEDLEHVTRYILQHPGQFSTAITECEAKEPKLTVDYPQDLQVAEEWLKHG